MRWKKNSVPAARSGVRLFLFDRETFQARSAACPGQYGLASAGGCQASLTQGGCVAASSAEQNSFFYWNDSGMMRIHSPRMGYAQAR